MDKISFTENDKNIPIEGLFKLYTDAQWTNYTADKNKLNEAYQNSDYVAYAWDNDKLVGAIRVISDGISIVYIQDLLVLKSHQHMGIGKKLMSLADKRYENVRQKVLITDKSVKTESFYKTSGFKDCSDVNITAFIKIGK